MDWQLVFNEISDPAMILDREHHILAANRSAAVLTGISSDKLIGKRCYEVCYGLPIGPANCPLKTLLSSKEKLVCAEEIEISDKIFEITVTPLFDKKGEVEKILHISRDITTQKIAEANLAENQARLQKILDTAR